jgi:redox-sensitive bicupin YhaK (pirin superfamily)
MTAGTGVRHSEKNPSEGEPVHLLQIWILPNSNGLIPGYEQKAFSEDERRGTLRLIASSDGREGSVTVHQDVNVFASILGPGQEVVHELGPNRYAWIQIARGAVTVNGDSLEQGDGASISGEFTLRLVGQKPAEVLLFDLA